MQSGIESANTGRTRANLRIRDEYLDQVLRGEQFLLFDGAMGTMLQRRGLVAGEQSEMLCLSDPDAITAIHRAYVEAGSQAVTTNTFGANREKLGEAATVDEVFAAAIACARDAGARYVAADLGPTGELLDPLGDLTFEEAYELFAEQAQAAEAHGADLIIIETMAALDEIEAAVRAAQDNSSLPVFATMTFAANGHTFLGTTPVEAARALGELGVEALGINCSLGPTELGPFVLEMLAEASCPVIVQANAGLPKMVGGEVTYPVAPDEYTAAVRPMVEAGARIIGGCCGTDPSYIEALASLIESV